jgi:hypothetical protein
MGPMFEEINHDRVLSCAQVICSWMMESEETPYQENPKLAQN